MLIYLSNRFYLSLSLDRFSYNPGWLPSHYVLTLALTSDPPAPLPPECWDGKGAHYRTQFMHCWESCMVSFVLRSERTASPHTPPAEATLSPRSFHFAVFEAGSHVLGTQYVADTDLELLILLLPMCRD